MQCPRCKQENLAQARFCLKCGAPVKLSAGGDASEASYPELQGSLSEALARERATGEILRVIGSSPTDAQPVFETIARSGVSVCAALGCAVFVVDGDMLRVAATHGVRPQRLERFRQEYPVPLDSEIDSAQTIRGRRIFHLADIEHNPNASASDIENARLAGYRTRLMVPMVRGDRALGLIAVTREAPTPFSDQQVELLKTFADQAVIAIENVRLFTELEARNRDLTIALEQRTATSEILRVISSSPTDLQPIFGAIASSAIRLCDAAFSVVFRFDGEMITVAADDGRIPGTLDVIRSAYPSPPGRQSMAARAILGRRVICIADAQASTEDPQLAERARAIGYRSILVAPMLRGDEAIGAINVARLEAIPFTDTQIALLQTFADQAVIAIENVRLFTELQENNRALTQAHAQVTETLDQQTATSEVLRVIAGSPTDLQPVLDTLVESAGRLCQAADTFLLLIEGDQLGVAALHGAEDEGARLSNAIHRGWAAGRAVVDARTVHVEDLANAEAEFPLGAAIAARFGHRTALAIPLLRKGVPIGALFLRRREVRQFSDKEIALLETFADQAVIAIENVRLFTELQVRNHDLAEALIQQTATSEVLKVISRSTFDLQPVLQTLIENATRLCDAQQGFIYRSDGEIHQLAVDFNAPPAFTEWSQQRATMPGDGSVVGRVALEKRVVQILDAQADAEWRARTAHAPGITDVRTLLGVPMLRDGVVIGVFAMWRSEIRPFTDKQIDLVMTFADQAVIAIQNVRLFKEIEEKSHQLEVASQHKSEFLANMSHELRTPLNAIIGFSEVLTDRMFGELNEKQDEYLKDIYASGQHLLSLINDILDLSKIEAGRMELELTDFDLPMAIDNALTLVRERASRRGITLKSTVGERVGSIRGDERKMKQVLLNLLSNAIKFTQEGGRIDVTTARDDGAVEVSVSDTGVGIAPEDLEAVFEEFRQVGAGAAKQEGTGLGLALCRKFIELHGGSIRVESAIGAGSTFTFRLPIRK